MKPPLCGKPRTRRPRSDGAFRQGLPRPRRLGAERLVGCGLVFGFPSVSEHARSDPHGTLATCRFQVLEFPRHVARETLSGAVLQRAPGTARVISARIWI